MYFILQNSDYSFSSYWCLKKGLAMQSHIDSMQLCIVKPCKTVFKNVNNFKTNIIILAAQSSDLNDVIKSYASVSL